MAETNETHHHIVEIAIENDHQKQLISTLEAIQDHPLMEISESPGHLLLLKLFQRDQHLFNEKIIRKESHLISLKSDIFNLCLYFFTFHMFFFTALFTSLNEKRTNSNDNVTCRKFWIPMIVLLSTCLMMVFWVQVKVYRYWKVYGEMMSERSESRALTRCVQELRMKGVSFDLSKEISGNGKRIKSSSVEIKWKPLSLCLKYFVTICFVGVTGIAVPVCRFMVCV